MQQFCLAYNEKDNTSPRNAASWHITCSNAFQSRTRNTTAAAASLGNEQKKIKRAKKYLPYFGPLFFTTPLPHPLCLLPFGKALLTLRLSHLFNYFFCLSVFLSTFCLSLSIFIRIWISLCLHYEVD
jgi:hypothetical protein